MEFSTAATLPEGFDALRLDVIAHAAVERKALVNARLHQRLWAATNLMTEAQRPATIWTTSLYWLSRKTSYAVRGTEGGRGVSSPPVQATVTPRGEKGSCAQTKTMSSQYLL
jgi:hypothetical protein